MTSFYFYLWDTDFGAAFIKVCAYFPYPIKVWVNGHEWAKRQATKAGSGYTALSNGFASCEDPQALPGHHRSLLPTLDGRAAVAADRCRRGRRILVGTVDAPDRDLADPGLRRAPARPVFFEALVVDNLDLGRPETLELVFGRKIRRGRLRRTQDVFKTKVVTRDTDVTINAFYKHSRKKQYLKDGRALRIETVVNSPDDLACHRRPEHLDELQRKARDINARLLDTERVGQGCVLASPAFERVARSTFTEDGKRAPALRFGDPRVMALLGTLCISLTALGFTHRSLRARVRHLPGTGYSTNQMSYDLARLRRNGLIERQEHSNTYGLTADGKRIALFYTKVHNRLLRPLLAADKAPAPPQLRQALSTIDRHIRGYIGNAQLETLPKNSRQTPKS